MSTPTSFASAAMRSWVGPMYCAADLGDRAVAEVVVEDPAADAVAGLEDHHRLPAPDQFPGCGQAGEARADDGDVRGAVETLRGRPDPDVEAVAPAAGFVVPAAGSDAGRRETRQ